MAASSPLMLMLPALNLLAERRARKAGRVKDDAAGVAAERPRFARSLTRPAAGAPFHQEDQGGVWSETCSRGEAPSRGRMERPQLFECPLGATDCKGLFQVAEGAQVPGEPVDRLIALD